MHDGRVRADLQDGFDNGGDGVADCSDPDCGSEDACIWGEQDSGRPRDDSGDADTDTDVDADTDVDDTGTADQDEVDIAAFFPLDDGSWTYRSGDDELDLRVTRSGDWLTYELVQDGSVVTGFLGEDDHDALRVEAVLGEATSFDLEPAHTYFWYEQTPGSTYGGTSSDEGRLSSLAIPPEDCDQGTCLQLEIGATGALEAIGSSWLLVEGGARGQHIVGRVRRRLRQRPGRSPGLRRPGLLGAGRVRDRHRGHRRQARQRGAGRGHGAVLGPAPERRAALPGR